MNATLRAAIESESSPLRIDFDTAVSLYREDESFRERCDEYADAMRNAPRWWYDSEGEFNEG